MLSPVGTGAVGRQGGAIPLGMATPPDIAILRPGTYTDINGVVVSFGRTEMEQIVASYDAANPAPLVIGHPKTDDPAWGWVGGVRIDGDTLVVAPADVAPEFAETVRAGRYRKISPSFYPPNNPANPTPGKWSLKHVGFLGAAAPSIKGLGTVAFSDAADASVTIIPPENVMDTNTDADVAFAERETALSTREADLLAREATLIAAEKKATHDNHVAFAEAQVERGTLAPAGQALVVGLLDTLAPLAVVSFGEENGDLSPVDALKRLFDGAQPVVSFGELAPADPANDPVEHKPEAIADRALAFAASEAAEGRIVTVQAAVRHVMAADATA